MIHISHKKNLKKILIENSIQEDKDIQKLYEALSNESAGVCFEVIFVDIKSVPSLIVKKLSSMENSLHVITTQRTLWFYLSKLGIKNTLQCTSAKRVVKIKEPLRAIVLGGSAGSLEKIIAFIKEVPYVDISIFIVMHILPNKQSHMSDILEKLTYYKVYEAQHNMKVEKNSIYIAPPDNHLVVTDGFIYLDHGAQVNFSRPSIDLTFKSLAYEYQKSLLAILLCGYGKDGSDSLKDLQENNCEIIIEDPTECEAKDMLLHAIETNRYTKVLEIQKIISYVKSVLSVSVDIKDEIENFLESIYIVYGYDFRHYDRRSLSRRIKFVMHHNGFTDFKKFEQMIFEDEKAFDKLLRSFSINVTSFFRNKEVFLSIKKRILPYIQSFPSIRVWCAGCSKGDEPYSVAMMLDEAGLLNKSQIYATDFNHSILAEAENGLYSTQEFQKYKTNYHNSGGQEEFEKWFDIEKNFVQVKKKIKNRVIFFKHNLVTDSTINEFHLIFCRNVLIYFNKDLQKRVFDIIDESLFRNGFLVLGESETIDKECEYKTVGTKKHKIYKKELIC